MNLVHHIIVIYELELVTVELLHAASLELLKSNLSISNLPIELFIAKLEQVFELREEGRATFVDKYGFNQLLGPLVHEHVVMLVPLELSLIDAYHFRVEQLIYIHLLFCHILLELNLCLLIQAFFFA